MLIPTLLCAQPKVVAHRGYWRTDGSAQNSVTSMELAARHRVWGCEFDVRLTADGVLVCNHDEDINGISVLDNTYAQLQFCKQSHGELLPTLAQYLREAKKYPHMKLVLELKNCKNDTDNAKAVDDIVKMVEMMGMQQQVDYIAFSLFNCKRFHEKAPYAKVAYLTGDLNPKQIKDLGLTGIDYHFNVFKKNPTWAKEAKELGLEVNVWTVDGEEALREHAAMPYIDYITTNDPLILKQILKGGKGMKHKNKDGRKGDRKGKGKGKGKRDQKKG